MVRLERRAAGEVSILCWSSLLRRRSLRQATYQHIAIYIVRHLWKHCSAERMNEMGIRGILYMKPVLESPI